MARRIVTVEPIGYLQATRDMTLNGVVIKAGAIVDTRKLSKAKVAQLLDHRLLRPAHS